MNVKENNLDIVMEFIRDTNAWDNIDFIEAEDHDGNTYLIFSTNEDIAKFSSIVRNVLGIEEERFYLDDVLGVNVEYYDEYTTCDDCGKVIRTEPNSYHWQPDYYMGDGFIICNVCFNENEDYQEAYIEDRVNNPKNAINGLMSEEQIKSLGFEKPDAEYENGWYHVEDKPEEVYDKLKDSYDEVLFYINNVEQFRINFVVFVRGEVEGD
jgi:hypothetical protein